jgi:hypothetical protein
VTSMTVRDALDARREVRDELRDVSDKLIAEFSAVVPPGRVLRSVAAAREELLRNGVRAGLAPATEAMARLRLVQVSPAHEIV